MDFKKITWGIGLGLLSFNLFAQGQYQIPRVEKAPIIDGVINADEWKHASQVELAYETSPGDSLPAKVKTTAYMMEDGQYLYFAFKAEDPEPEKILAYLRDRDSIFRDDFVGIIIDTFNDERRGFEFFVNPLGAQGDLTRDDSRFNEDASWDAVWDSMGKVTKQGYVVEMAIPFREIRFPSGLEEQTWGIQFLRIYPRDSRTVFSDSKNDRNLDCSLCQAKKLKGMPNLKMGQNIDVTPTLTSLSAEQRDPATSSAWQSNNATEVGLDLRWAMTENWILNATINPDFSQVEADAGQLDINTTFSLFYPEARPFFLDGADYFSSSNRLVHTRNIANPDYGIKVTGKSNGQSSGVILAQDTSTSFLLPGSLGSNIAILDNLASDILIARYQKDVGDKSHVGALITYRSKSEYSNQVTAIDGKYFFTEFDSLEFQYMRSDSKNPLQIQSDFGLEAKQSDDALTLRYRRSKKNYGLSTSYVDFGKDFRADMGFISQVDYKKLALGGNYTWYGKKGSPWTRWGIFSEWDKTEDQAGKKLKEEVEFHFNISGPMQYQTNMGVVSRNRYYNNQYFDETRYLMWFQFKPWSNFTLGNFMLFGDQIDFSNTQIGEITLFDPYINWQIGKHFNLRLSSTYQKLKVPGGELFNAKLYDARLAYQFNIRSRLSLTIQTTDIDRNQALYTRSSVDSNSKTFGTQLIYSYKINPLSLVYVGYSDNARDDDNLDSLLKTDKTIFAKFSYRWQI
ncbi:MAG: DUF5916 domain-containing protein [Enterobacterales bacterium]|nr:DUF5916 domain-containing protein [Enterobacterales bacterium]